MKARPTAPHPGAAFEPTGDPMKDGLGAAAWVERDDRCDLTLAGEPKIQPMSILPDFHVDKWDPDPHGFTVIAGDGVAVGTITDLWVDRSEPQLRYLTVTLKDGGKRLIPAGYAVIRGSKKAVLVNSIFAKHFPDVPQTKADDRITLLEEDKLFGYYAGGLRYAEPSRNEPFF